VALSIRRALQAVLLALSLASLVGLVVDFHAVRSLAGSLTSIERNQLRQLVALKAISDAYAVTIVDTTHKVSDEAITWEEGRKNVSDSLIIIAKTWAEVKAADLSADEARLAAEYEALMARSLAFMQRLEAALKAEDHKTLRALRTKELYPTIDPLTEKIDLLVKSQLKSAGETLGEANATGTLAKTIQMATGGFLALLTVVGIIFVNRKVVGAIEHIRDVMGELASGRLDVDLPETASKTEIGAMARAVEVFRENAAERQRLEEQARRERALELKRQKRIDELIRDFRGSIGTIRMALDQQLEAMQSSSGNLGQIAEDAAKGASLAQEASSDSSSNVSLVANAAGELTSASREISTQVHKAGDCVTRAMDVARMADHDVSSLAELADRIGAIIQLINSIAEQTNMLALNATIEAARAGEAGRSFAVVASEVKTLAGQTAKATEEISGQVSAIQGATRQAVNSIRTITATVSEIEGQTTAIAAAVEEQEASTHEISRSISLASGGSVRVAENVGSMAQSVEKTSAEAQSLRITTTHLASVAGELSQSVDAFLANVMEDVKERRQATRRVMQQAAVVFARGRRSHTQVIDISETGVRIEAVPDLQLGETIQLEWSSGHRLKGRAVWIAKGQAGVAFDEKVPEALIDMAGPALAA